jgi:hypothetical protein
MPSSGSDAAYDGFILKMTADGPSRQATAVSKYQLKNLAIYSRA